MSDPEAQEEPPFEIDVRTVPGHNVVTVRGEVDVFTAPRLRQVLFDPVLCSEPRVVIDLDEVTFMDSTGIGTLVAARRWATSRDSVIVLACGGGPALRLLELVSLDKVFELKPSVSEATGVA